MGMAASQARLLALTARIHDVEYQAQSIQNAKVQLSTQEDQVYQEYQDALDATTLTFTAMDPKSGEKSTITANFNNLFSINRAYPKNGRDYALFNSRGKIVVDEELFNGYESFIEEGYPESAYAFALFMMGDQQAFDVEDLIAFETSVVENNYIVDSNGDVIGSEDETLEELYNNVVNVLCEYGEADPDTVDIYDTNDICYDNEAMSKYRTAMNQYLNYLYKNYAEQVYNFMNQQSGVDAPEFDRETFDYYVKMFKVIQQCGGCISIEDYNGSFNGDAKNDSEWLTNMVESGQMTIRYIVVDSRTGDITINGTNPGADENIKYTTTTEIDKVALAKAEAKYEHDLKLINKKDKEFDLSLSRLETERQALTTEYDSVKKVIQDNIDRTFGIFS